MEISRREFIRKMVVLGFSATNAWLMFSLLACGNEEIGTPTPAHTITPSPLVSPDSTQVPLPTSVPTDTTPLPDKPSSPYLAVARGENPTAMVHTAIGALGGIGRFVKSGNDVIIKPNICVAYHTYEYAATTNPEVIGALTALCLGAGARRVRVMDSPFGGTPDQAYARSGIEEAVHNAGGQMEVMSSIKFQETSIPEGHDISSWPIYRDVLDSDVFINVPIAKHHSLARLTLGMKNLMGIIQNRNQLHFNLGQRIADITSLVRPALTVVDAVRILTNHGPTGGSLNDVKLTNTIIASHDIVAADAYAATLFDLTGTDIPAIRAGAQMGLGTMDLSNIQIEEIRV